MYHLVSKMVAFEKEKYSKNDGVLFEITLFACSRRGRKTALLPIILGAPLGQNRAEIG